MWKASEERASEMLMEVPSEAEAEEAEFEMPHAEAVPVQSSGATKEPIPFEVWQAREKVEREALQEQYC